MATGRPQLRKADSVVQFAQSLTKDQVSLVKELFDAFDEDKDGNLSKSELRELLKELSVNLNDNEFEQLFEKIDLNRDGTVQKQEFIVGLRWIQKAKKFVEENRLRKPPMLQNMQKQQSLYNFVATLREDQVAVVKELFDMCDVDKDGVVTRDELKVVMNKLQLQTSEREFETFWNDLDRRHDGKLTFDEFVRGLKWLQRGVQLTLGEEKKGLSVEEKNEMLIRYVQDVLEKATEVASRECDNRKYHTARAILDIIDWDIAKTLESYVGPIINSKADRNYQEILKNLQ